MKVAIVYATTTGNTEQLANAAAEGAKSAGREVSLTTADKGDISEALGADLILLGSPAMGAEQLEESMEDFFSGIEGQLGGKKVGLFGSYDWGEGQWLSDWSDRVTAAGATLVGAVKAQLTPDDAALEEVKKLAAS
ncbi:MAG: flavodoxin domain-containing protein [Treponema sp.]|uniref:flavodoxin domain-containing protein n=1 Tax=Treponema sp. TaxID=166 RepID=UPI0025F2FC2C|nr:flavodoxin domain-containing protein [Treponema sp.]MBR0494782.1 flavodoxin domain-containing protein [Treponema sp.]